MENNIFKPIGLMREKYINILVYKNQYELMYSLARFQEFYENPVLKFPFSRVDVQDWQPNYYVSWNGCNFPPDILDHFRKNAIEWDLDGHEKYVLDLLKDESKYTVGVNLESSFVGTLKHERAHGFYFLCEDYREQVNALIDALWGSNKLLKEKERLLEMGYSEKVVKDEIQAYSYHGWEKISEDENPALMVELHKKYEKELTGEII